MAKKKVTPQDIKDTRDRRDRYICEQRSLSLDLSERKFAAKVGFSQTTVRNALKREKDGDFTPKEVG